MDEGVKQCKVTERERRRRRKGEKLLIKGELCSF